MELTKRKYKKKEVEIYIDGIKGEYELKFIEQRAKIRELLKEVNELKCEIESFKEKEYLILSALSRAEKTAKEIEQKAKLEYELEVKKIKNFSSKWKSFIDELNKQYSKDSKVKKAVKVSNNIKALSNTFDKKAIDELDKQINVKKEKFNPKSKIKDYIVATSDNGFNMDEVLNPGSLKLEDICKELGLIEGNE